MILGNHGVYRGYWLLLASAGMLALLAGCSNQDFGTSLGSITDVLDSGKAYVPKDNSKDTEQRSAQLAKALLAWQRQHGLSKEDYSVGPDDVLDVTIYDLEKPGEPSTQHVAVEQDGTISLPLVGRLHVAGSTAHAIEEQVIDRYSGAYLKDPRATVTVASFRSAPVVVTGAVGKPGVYYLQHNASTVLEMLSDSQGLAANAGQELLIVRGGTGPQAATTNFVAAADTNAEAAADNFVYDFSTFPTNGLNGSATNSAARADADALNPEASDAGAEIITVDLGRLLDAGDIRLNVPIHGGDIITVPARQTKYIYVLGYVQRPGAFEVSPGRDAVNALQAVALSGGLSSAARAQNSFLIHEQDGRRKVIQVDLTKIARGVRPPVFMQPGDTLVVGSGWLARLGEFIKPSVSAGASYTPVP